MRSFTAGESSNTYSQEYMGKFVLVAFFKPVSKRWGAQYFNGTQADLNALYLANRAPDWTILDNSFETADEALDAAAVLTDSL